MDVDEGSIEACLARMAAAWDAGDAAAFAREFTEDPSYVLYVGLTYLGRAEIERAHVPVLTRWRRGTRLRMHVLRTQMIGPDTAVVVAEGGIGRRTVRRDKVQTCTMVRRDGRWRCAAFQNTRRHALLVRVNQLADPR